MNEQILALIKSFKTGGGYTWNPKTPTSGVSMDIIYKEQAILKKDTTTFCSGVTFMTWFILFGKFLDIEVHEMKRLQQDWYVNTGKRAGPVDALVPRGLGVEVKLNEALPGDFCQLWRNTGSGHSVVYLAHDEMSIKYWSSQKPVTNGIGIRSEPRTGKSAVVETHLVRAILPALPGTV